MRLTSDPQTESCLETLCGNGCKAVYTIIKDMKAGRFPPCAIRLSRLQRKQLLKELQNIMSVYSTAKTCTL